MTDVNNSITLIGNVGGAPEEISTKSGNPMARFSLATNERWKDKDGNSHTNTEWHNIVAFGPVVKVITSYVRSGSKLAVQGKLKYNKWEDKDGNKRTTAQIHLESISLLDGKSDSTEERSNSTKEEKSSKKKGDKKKGKKKGKGGESPASPEVGDDGLPF